MTQQPPEEGHRPEKQPQAEGHRPAQDLVMEQQYETWATCRDNARMDEVMAGRGREWNPIVT